MALKGYHEKSTLSTKVSLLRKFFALKLSETGNIEQHLQQIEDRIDQLAAVGETLAEKLTAAIILSSLPGSYRTLITALETRPEEDLTQELVKNKLLEEYSKRTEQASVQREVDDQKALKTSVNVHKQEQQQSKQVNKLLCYFCNKPNHMKKECKKYIEWKKIYPDHKTKALCEDINYQITEPNDDEDLYSCFSVEQENVNKMNSN